MSGNPWTPGPWKASGIYVATDRYPFEYVAVMESRETSHRDRRQNAPSLVTSYANGRLISLAPDLATALTDLVEQLDGSGIPEWHGAEGLAEMMPEIRALLAKARGGA